MKKVSLTQVLSFVLLSAVAVIFSVNTGFAQQYFYGVKVDSTNYTGGDINVSAQVSVANNVFHPGNVAISTTSSALIRGALVYVSTGINIGNFTGSRNSVDINKLTSPNTVTITIDALNAYIETSGTIGDIAANENSVSVKDFLPYADYITAASLWAEAKSVGNITVNSNSANINGLADEVGSVMGASMYAEADSKIGNVTANSNNVKIQDANVIHYTAAADLIIYASTSIGNITANSNKVEINNANYVNRVYGLWMDSHIYSSSSSLSTVTANFNEVSISSSYVEDNALNSTSGACIRAEGFSSVTADNNKVTILDSSIKDSNIFSVEIRTSDVDGYVRWLAIKNVQANNNSILISASNLNSVYAYGVSVQGINAIVNNNSVLIQNSLLSNGGWLKGVNVNAYLSGKANNNSLTIKNVIVENGEYIIGAGLGAGEFWYYAGWDFNSAVEYGAFEATNNSVRLENIAGDGFDRAYGASMAVYGGIGKVNKNSVYMLNAKANDRVYGGYNYAEGGSLATEQYANENSVTLINSWADYVYGGYSRSNNTRLYYSTTTGNTEGIGNTLNFANNNTVSITGGEVRVVCGGAARSQTSNAQANNNSVIIENASYISDRVGGGSARGAFLADSLNGNITANGNFVSIKNSLYGGDGAVAAEVRLDNAASAGNITANSNKLEIYNTSKVWHAFGAMLASGASASTSSLFNINLSNNEVSIVSSYADYIYGSDLYFNGVANTVSDNNKVKISNSVSNGSIYGACVYNYSSYAANGKFSNSQANNNSVSISGSYANNVNGVNIDGDNIIATGNSVTITDSLRFENVRGAYGEAYLSGTFSGNSVSIKNTNGYNGSGIYGAYLRAVYDTDNLYTDKYASAGHGVFEASENSVYIENIKGWSDVYGARVGANAGIGKVNKNSVYILDSTVDEVYGACIGNDGWQAIVTEMYANENSVTLINSNADGNIYGGSSWSHAVRASTASTSTDGKVINFANNNTVYVKGGIIQSVYGGYAYSQTSNAQANNNTVVIENVAKVYDIYGGEASGKSDEQVQAINNTVTIIGGLNVEGNICGGRAENSGTGGVDRMTGNTLNVKGGHITASGIRGFENYNLYVANLDTPVIYAINGGGYGNLVDVSSSNVNLFLHKGVKVATGDKIDLIRSGCGVTNSSNTQASAKGGVSKIYTFDIAVNDDGDILQACVLSADNNKEVKALSEGVAAGAILAGLGADIVNSGLLANLQEGKIEVVGAFFGGKSKYDTGSSVELNSLGAAAGLAKQFACFGGFAAGIFVEYASSDFDTEYSGINSTGKADYIGGGILARKDVKENLYVEGLVRGGKVNNDYKTKLADDYGTTADFDYSSTYFGFGLGAGRIFAANEKLDIDLFGKYTLTSVSGGDADLETGEKYEFDSVLSNRLQIGAKGEYKASETIKPYLSLSLDYELSGEVNAKIDGEKIEAPSFGGATFSAGLGASAKVIENLTLDLSTQFHAGARAGFGGLLKLKYKI